MKHSKLWTKQSFSKGRYWLAPCFVSARLRSRCPTSPNTQQQPSLSRRSANFVQLLSESAKETGTTLWSLECGLRCPVLLNIKSIARQLQDALRSVARQQEWHEQWLKSMGISQQDDDEEESEAGDAMRSARSFSMRAMRIGRRAKAALFTALLNVYFFIIDSGSKPQKEVHQQPDLVELRLLVI